MARGSVRRWGRRRHRTSARRPRRTEGYRFRPRWGTSLCPRWSWAAAGNSSRRRRPGRAERTAPDGAVDESSIWPRPGLARIRDAVLEREDHVLVEELPRPVEER